MIGDHLHVGIETFQGLFRRFHLGRAHPIVGVQNLLVARPDEIAGQALVIGATGGSFPTGEETPIGLNGRTYYTRLTARF